MKRVSPEEVAGLLRGGAPPAILDVRPDESFVAGHLAGAGHVPGARLPERRAELPPRDRPVLVVAASGGEALAVAGTLATMEFRDVAWLDGSVDTLDSARDTAPARRLWEPNGFLARRLESIPRGRALDVAAGAGRDAVYLALHGFDVEAWDHDAGALARAAGMAGRHGVTVRTRVCDLEAHDAGLPEAEFALVCCFRFLHRPLFPALARALAPGGHLLYETFRRGQELRGHPRRPRFLLEAGELREAFRELDLLAYEEAGAPSGPLTSSLHARRPADAGGT